MTASLVEEHGWVVIFIEVARMKNIFQALMIRSPFDLDYTRMIIDLAKEQIHNRPLFPFTETLESFPWIAD